MARMMPSRSQADGVRRSAAHRLFLSALVVVSILTWAGPASAQIPDHSSAVDQYVEDIPTTGGSAAAGGGPGRPGGGSSGGAGTGGDATTRLPSGIVSALEREGGREAALLEDVATSEAYGAPQTTLGGSEAARETLRRLESGELDEGTPGGTSTRDALAAAVSAVDGGEGMRLVGLFIALILIAGAALAAAGLRHRRRAL